MSVWRFVLGLVLLALMHLALQLGRIELTPVAVAGKAGEAIGAVLGGLLWGLILWGPIRLIRGAERAPEIRVFTLATAAVLMAIFMTATLTGVRSPATNKAEDFKAGIERGCFKAQREAAANSEQSSERLRAYCGCIASSLADTLTAEEIETVKTSDAFPGSVQEKIRRAGADCRATLTGGTR